MYQVNDLLDKHKHDEAINVIDDLIARGEITIVTHPKFCLFKATAYEKKATQHKGPSYILQYLEG